MAHKINNLHILYKTVLRNRDCIDNILLVLPELLVEIYTKGSTVY
jgi:hypothetical protein